MKVVYAGRDVKKRKVLLAQHQNVIVLLHDNWDDYTFKTTFPTDCRMKGANVEIGGVQILIENEKTSFAYLTSWSPTAGTVPFRFPTASTSRCQRASLSTNR